MVLVLGYVEFATWYIVTELGALVKANQRQQPSKHIPDKEHQGCAAHNSHHLQQVRVAQMATLNSNPQHGGLTVIKKVGTLRNRNTYRHRHATALHNTNHV